MLLAGCASTSGIAPRGELAEPAALGLEPVSTAFPASDWWRRFGDAELNRLVTKALADNPDLQVAAARLRAARAQVQAAGAPLKPQLQASINSTRERFSANDIYPPPLGGSWYSENEALLQGSWELDFFGRVHEKLAAAVGNERATAASEQAARVLIAANVANAYFNLARLRALHEVLERTLAQRRAILELVHERVSAGVEGTIPEHQAASEVPQIGQQIRQTEVEIEQARNALAALSGAGPQATASLSPSLSALPDMQLPQTLPAALIGRRADLVAARWQVDAALHGVNAARAAFYPNVNLMAFAGFTALGFDNWLNGSSRYVGAGPALTLPIFEGGALRADLRQASARADEAIATYNSTLVGAVREVADALAARQSIGDQIQQQHQALTQARLALDLAEQRYRAGDGSYLTVLTVEGQVLALERAEVNLKAQSFTDDVALIRALGGGFEGQEPSAPDLAAARARKAPASSDK